MCKESCFRFKLFQLVFLCSAVVDHFCTNHKNGVYGRGVDPEFWSVDSVNRGHLDDMTS